MCPYICPITGSLMKADAQTSLQHSFRTFLYNPKGPSWKEIRNNSQLLQNQINLKLLYALDSKLMSKSSNNCDRYLYFLNDVEEALCQIYCNEDQIPQHIINSSQLISCKYLSLSKQSVAASCWLISSWLTLVVEFSTRRASVLSMAALLPITKNVYTIAVHK